MGRQAVELRLRLTVLICFSVLNLGGTLSSKVFASKLRISNVIVQEVTDISAVISWRTNIPTESKVEYGEDRPEAVPKSSLYTQGRSHSVMLTELQPNTTYYFRIRSQPAKGRQQTSAQRFFRTSQKMTSTPPTVSNVLVEEVEAHSATVLWQTDQLADSRLLLRNVNDRISITIESDTLSTNHNLTVRGLAGDAEYAYEVFSRNAFGQSSNSVGGRFTTSSPQDPEANVPPVPIIQILNKPISDHKISVSAGETVRFLGSRSYDANGDSLFFLWSFGDGEVSRAKDPEHTYAQAGLYEVTLTVDDDRWDEYPTNPFVIPIDQPALTERGGIIVADFDSDGLLDYALSTKEDPERSEESRATIGVYSHNGSVLWLNRDVDLRINKGYYGLPGRFAPGLAAADVDADGEIELLHLTTRDKLAIRSGATGVLERELDLPAVSDSASFWGHFQVVNLRGRGDRDVILQADIIPNLEDLRNKFPWLTAVSMESGEVLWSTAGYDGVRHGGFRAADLDFDGLDEVAGAVLIDHDGSRMNHWKYRSVWHPGHLDALHFADVKPAIPGLEVVLLEEAKRDDERVAIFNSESVFSYASRNGEEPQNAAIGDFAPNLPGLEIWCRSRFDFDQIPWVLDQDGNVIAEWRVNNKKPAHWTIEGIEFIYRIDWDGGPKQCLAAKERHREGDVALIDAMTGEFIRTWSDQAARLYVADVAGDYREEIIVVNSQEGEIHIYWNEDENSVKKPRYWRLNSYRREKVNYNYYSP
ncbi:PKD domain-containing protein [bacterium]|nr:PKD domain-containing protein [bacterium]